MKTPKEFADFVKNEMKRQILTDDELAKMSGVHTSTIWNLCNGFGFPNLGNAFKIADALNCDVSFVTRDNGKRY